MLQRHVPINLPNYQSTKLIYRIFIYNLINYLFNYLFMEFYWKNKTFVCDLKSMNKD